MVKKAAATPKDRKSVERAKAIEKIARAMVGEPKAVPHFSQVELLPGCKFGDFEALHSILRDRKGAFLSNVPQTNNLLGLLALLPDRSGLPPDFAAHQREREAAHFDVWAREKIAALNANPVFRHLQKTASFKILKAEFLRLQKVGKHPSLASPFAQLDLVACLVWPWLIYLSQKRWGMTPHRALAPKRSSAVAAARKLLALMQNDGVRLRDSLANHELQKQLTALKTELERDDRASRDDDTANGRQAAKEFVLAHYAKFGFTSPLLTRAFSELIGYEISRENISRQIKAIGLTPADYKPETYFHAGVIDTGEKLPFPIVIVFPQK